MRKFIFTLGLATINFATGSEFSAFAADNLTIGNGNLSAIAGAIFVGSPAVLSQVIIDDRSDTTSRQAT